MKKENFVIKNIFVLILLSVVLKGIGFINRIVIAYFYGTTDATDMYYNVSGFVESISAIILAGLTVGIINIYISIGDKKKNNVFISNVIIFIEIFMIFLMLLCMTGNRVLVRLLAPGYSADMYAHMSMLMKVMVIVFPFQGIITILGAVLQANNKFKAVKLTGSLSSIVSILAILFFSKYLGEDALVLSFLLGNVLNAAFLVINIRNGFHFQPEKFWRDVNLKQLMFLVGPLVIGIAGHQLNLIFDKTVASQIIEGAVSAISYSCVLYLFIENVVINSIVTALFPDLVEKRKSGCEEELATSVRKAIMLAEIILVPVVIYTFFNSKNIITIVYMRGNFNERSLSLTSAALRGYVVGLPFLAIRDIITRVYYSYDDTKTPVKMNLFSVAINIALDIVLGRCLGVGGITLATSISNSISGVCMVIGIRKKNKYIINIKLIKEIFIISLAGFLSILICNVIFRLDSMGIELLLSFSVFIIEVIFLGFGKSESAQYLRKIFIRIRKM